MIVLVNICIIVAAQYNCRTILLLLLLNRNEQVKTSFLHQYNALRNASLYSLVNMLVVRTRFQTQFSPPICLYILLDTYPDTTGEINGEDVVNTIFINVKVLGKLTEYRKYMYCLKLLITEQLFTVTLAIVTYSYAYYVTLHHKTTKKIWIFELSPDMNF